MNKTEITFYRGLEGMGICIEVKYNKDRVIFDFGAPFEPLTEVLDPYILRRDEKRVKDAIILHKACAIDGVYSQKDIGDCDLIPYEKSDLNTAILVCHLHLDHMSEIDKVAPDIPVYIHSLGLKMEEVIEEMESTKKYRSYQSFEYNQSFMVGKIKITPYFSDHTCAGSASFLIETPDQKILYTGDIRYHALNRELAYKQMEEIAKEKLDLVIIDATTSSPSEFTYNEALKQEYKKPSKTILPGLVTEDDLYEDVYAQLKEFDGIGVFNMFPRDLSMLKSMVEVGERLNRETVYEPYYANILYQLTSIRPTVIESDCDEHNPKYIQELKEVCKFVSMEDIKNNPSHYLLQNSFKHILDLIDLDGIPGIYFHLMGEPLVDGTKNWQVMLNFLKKLNWPFKSYTNLYSFSHSYPNHLAYVLQLLNAKAVVGVHSKHPENINPVNSKQYFPEHNVKYYLVDGKLIKA